MNYQDSVQHFIFEELPIRGEIVHLNHSFQKIMEQHQYPPLVRRWLGEALVLVSLLSTIIKYSGRLSIQFQGKGKFKLLLVQCNNDLHLRGLAQWDGGDDLTEQEIIESLKQGTIVITIDPESGKQRYQGVVAWQGETLSESIEGYFLTSEQLPTRIWVTVDEKGAAGFLLQSVPQGGADYVRRELGVNHDWEHVNFLTDTLTPHELLNLDNKTLLHRLYVEEDIRIFESKRIIFQCTCSRERSANAILILGRADAEDELKTKKELAVKCEFCNREYVFDAVDVAAIFHKAGDPPSSTEH